MKKQTLRILYFAIQSDYAKQLNQLLNKDYNVEHALYLDTDSYQENLASQQWDIIITHQHGTLSETNAVLTRINDLFLLPPIILIYRIAFESRAQHLLNTDTQVKAIVSEPEIHHLLQACRECIKPFLTQVNEADNSDELDMSYDVLRRFIQSTSAGIWVINESIVTTYVNAAMANMLGYTPEEMLGRTLFSFMDENGIAISKRNLKRRAAGLNETHDFEFLRKDGSRVFTTLETTPIFENGQYKGGIACFIDTTKKHLAELKYLRINRAQKTIRTCVRMVARARNELDLINQICRVIVELGGYRMCWVGFAEQDEEKNVTLIAKYGDHHDYLDKVSISWGDNRLGKGPTGTAIRTGKLQISREITNDIRMHPWQKAITQSEFKSSIALPLIYENEILGALNIYSDEIGVFDADEQQLLQELSNELTFGIMAIRDKTARKQAELELRQHKIKLEDLVWERTKELEQSNRELESFSYSVSHDLRAPLRHINGYSSILRNDYAERLDKDATDILQRIESAAQNMGLLIDHLLDFARLNRQELSVSKINLSEIATEVKEQFSERIEKRHVQFNIPQSIKAEGDRQLVRLIFQNLFDNALKFTKQKDNPSIQFNADYTKVPTVYYVSDNGVGFDMRFVNKIFGTFERLHTEKQFRGTGIGLATVKRIVERHGGKIWADSEVNKGTTIYFTLRKDPGTLDIKNPDTLLDNNA